MNNPEDMPIDHREMLDWLLAYRARKALSWGALAKDSGVPHSTLSLFASGKYQGNVENIARRLYQYRQKTEMQEDRAREVIAPPPYIEMPTSRRVLGLLGRAHMGRITVAAMGPGTCKTRTAEFYKASIGETVWLATMRQTTRSTTAMIAEVMRAMGITSKSGWTQQRSAQIIEFVAGKRGLLVIDEANHLEWAALEELRGLHDATGLGIALLGNEELMMRIRGGATRHAYARLNRRIAMAHIQDMPLEEDVAAFCDAMELIERPIRKLLTDAALHPGNGGLGEVAQILESAHILSIGDGEPLGLGHFEEAVRMRLTTQLRRAA